MSFDVCAQRLVNGDTAEADSDVLRTLIAPHVVRTEPEFDFAELHFDDGAADVHGIDEPGTGFMVDHVSGDLAWDLLAKVVETGGMTLLPVGAPPMVFSEAMRAHLPHELAGEAVIVTSDADMLHTIAEA